MDNFDKYLKFRAIADVRAVPAGFDARSNALLLSLGTPTARVRHLKVISALRFAAAVALSLILLAGAAAAAYTLSGGDYFRQLFQNAAGENGVNGDYMNTEQLGDMASSTVGTVIDTDELSVDVLGVLVSGGTARFDIRVTAKKLDTVLYDTGIEPLMNYRFHDDMSFFLLENGVKKDPGGLFGGSIQHIYGDEDERLAANQFIIRYSFVNEAPLKDKTYILTYKDFGYFDFDEPDQFKQLYEGEWPFTIVFDPADDTSRTVLLGQGLSAGKYEYTIDSVEITPLTCTVLITNAEAYYDGLDSRWQDVWNALYDKTGDFSVTLADGTLLDSSHYVTSGAGGGPPGYAISVSFNAPITVADVVSITIGGMDIPLP
jgi:hypothetical protein